jgi:hypothetical protein
MSNSGSAGILAGNAAVTDFDGIKQRAAVIQTSIMEWLAGH